VRSHRVAALARLLTNGPSRRAVLRGLASAGLGLGIARWQPTAEAKKKHKHKHKAKKPKPTAFGCLDVGKSCKSADQCCSGICGGKKGKKRCRAHGAGTCVQGSPGVCDPQNPTIALCNNDECLCVRTTGGSNYCANGNFNQCSDCTKDADCEALGLPPGSACIPFSEGACAGPCESGMTCVIPCGVEPPEPMAAAQRAWLIDGTLGPSRAGDK
jgi:hypothetical protein